MVHVKAIHEHMNKEDKPFINYFGSCSGPGLRACRTDWPSNGDG
jgi:hypothetical protein